VPSSAYVFPYAVLHVVWYDFYWVILHLQGPTVQGDISLTCDAWQASNTDGYFAVTAHWIKSSTPTTWELSSALIGFTRLNNAHIGVRLGQALFKVVKRVGIENKVCCDVLTFTLLLTVMFALEPTMSHHPHEDWPCDLRQCK
jgi:hypothetical protein